MPTNIIPFAFDDHLVRTITDERGEPWFVAKDVCRVLELENIGQAISSLDDDEKASFDPNIKIHDVGLKNILNENTIGRKIVTVMAESGRGGRPLALISESGMYALVFRSRKPEAKRFSKWVRAEVLPTLRKAGMYTMPTPEPSIPIPNPPVQPSPERLPLQMPDMDLPEAALYLRPTMRMRLWQDSLQSARLEGAGMAYALDCFVKLCTVMAKQPKPKDSPFREEVKQFIQSCCRPAPGINMRSHDLYEAFRIWRRNHGKGYMPSQKIFGETMGLFYNKLKSNGQWYRDVSLGNFSAVDK